jgi:hypothetical protein
MPAAQTFYQILAIGEQATFAELKKAYYRRAKECHPDRHGGSRAKEEEFKQLVHAFDVLSDPVRRHEYDSQLAFSRESGETTEATRATSDTGNPLDYYPRHGRPVMDTLADDILEELVVGNAPPRGATLQTLMRDLESTDRFVRFREAKTLYFQGHYPAALRLLREATAGSPANIMYHYYLARTAEKAHHYGLAVKHLELCLRLGAARNPPQYLDHIRGVLTRLQKQRGLLGHVANLLRPPPPQRHLDSDEAMIEEMNRALTRMLRKAHPAKPRRPKPPPRLPAPPE